MIDKKMNSYRNFEKISQFYLKKLIFQLNNKIKFLFFLILLIPFIQTTGLTQITKNYYLLPYKEQPAMKYYYLMPPQKDFSGTEIAPIGKEDFMRKKVLKVNDDSTSDGNFIEVRYDDKGEMLLYVELKDKMEITISVYNLLGNKVADIFRGSVDNMYGDKYNLKVTDFREKTQSLSNGIYICILSGYKNLRLKEKFIISR